MPIIGVENLDEDQGELRMKSLKRRCGQLVQCLRQLFIQPTGPDWQLAFYDG